MRSVKDLRDLVCVSCLSAQESRDDYFAHGIRLSKSSVNLRSALELDKDTICLWHNNSQTSISSILQKGVSPLKLRSGTLVRDAPLPHIHKNNFQHSSSHPEEDSEKTEGKRSVSCTLLTTQKWHLDELFKYIDKDTVTDWLTRAYSALNELRTWCHTSDNFVRFAHFWLLEIPYNQKVNLLQLEIGIIKDELRFAFGESFCSTYRPSDLYSILATTLPEYPEKLLHSGRQYLFLDYLDLMLADKTAEYKKMLSGVKYSTYSPHVAQWILAIRAFALASLWYAVVKFYQAQASNQSCPEPKSLGPVIGSPKADVVKERAVQCVQLGFVDVLHYLRRQHQLDPCMVDENRRNLVFLAVIHEQPKILEYLLFKVDPTPDVNQAADSGNTALHAAVNVGSAHLVSLLLQFPGIDVNATNNWCSGASALHLAVMHGHLDICSLLQKAGADTSLLLDGATPLQLAQDLGHETIANLIEG